MLVSVIMPTFNRRASIPFAIECFRSQTWKNKELIIVDDGDSVEDLVPEAENIRYFRSDRKNDIGSKRNFAVSMARGRYVVHFDDDDWSAPERMEHQIEYLHDSGMSVLSYYDILYWRKLDGKAYRCFPRPGERTHGATLCYSRQWWNFHRFPCVPRQEDHWYGVDAIRRGAMAHLHAGNMVVLTAHSGDSSGVSGNTCKIESFMDLVPTNFLRLTTDEFPEQFAEFRRAIQW
jgi:glycosyltransferase involved in cell wall biosynthesis